MYSLSFSVIIPTKNRQADLLETISAVLAQTRLPDELIVVDQSATDESGGELQKLLNGCALPRFVYIWDPNISGLPAARNAGFAASLGSLICYLDDDATPATDYLAEMERGFAGFTVWDGLCGRFTEEGGCLILRRMAKALFRRGIFHDDRARLAELKSPRPMRLLPGAAFCFRREVLESFSFDESLKGYALGEDVDFCMRIGKKFRLGAIPTTSAHHRRSTVGRPTPSDMWRRARASALYLWRRHRRHIGDDICLAWLQVGFGLEAVLLSFRNKARLSKKHQDESGDRLSSESLHNAEQPRQVMPYQS